MPTLKIYPSQEREYQRRWRKEYYSRPDVKAWKREYWRQYNIKNRAKIREYSHKSKIKIRHKRAIELTGRPKPEICDVCPDTIGKIGFDHDHATGMFRGWLCNRCNAILGFAKDDPIILRALAEYLDVTTSPSLEVLIAEHH